MPRRPRPLPAGLGTIFTTVDARRWGVTRRRLRARDLERPFFGMRAVPASEHSAIDEDAPLARDRMQRADVLRRARIYRHLMVRHAFFVGRTAAVIHDLPITHAGDLEVAVPAPHRAPRRRGIRGRKVAEHLVALEYKEGLAVASPASTWAMLAGELSVRELVVLGDAIVRIPRDDWGVAHPEQALGTIEQLQDAIAAGPRRGVAKLRQAIEHIRVGSASPLETEYRLDAAAAGLPEPQLDVPIRDGRGALIGITEVVYPEHRVLVEIEGDHHRTSRQQWERDIEKYAAYVAAGWEVVRLTSSHIRGRHPRAVEIVRAALVRHGWRP